MESLRNIFVLFGLSLSPIVSADVLSFTEANGIEIDALSVGSTESVVVVNTATSRPIDRDIVYTIGGIDLDGDSLEDFLTVVIEVTSTGVGEFDGNVTSSGNGSFGVNSDNDLTGQLDLEGEEITLAFGAISFMLSGSSPDPAILQQAFTEVRFRNYGVESRHFLNGDTSVSLDANPNADRQAVSGDTVRIGFADADDPLNNDGFRIRAFTFDLEIDATITAIPEPKTTALLGLGGLALMLRRV